MAYGIFVAAVHGKCHRVYRKLVDKLEIRVTKTEPGCMASDISERIVLLYAEKTKVKASATAP